MIKDVRIGDTQALRMYCGETIVWEKGEQKIPKQYKQVEYLMSDGNQWINTGVSFDGHIEFEAYIEMLPTSEGYLLSAIGDGNSRIAAYGWYGGTSKNTQFALGGYYIGIPKVRNDGYIKAIIENGYQMFEGETVKTYNYTTNHQITTIPLYLFARNVGNAKIDQNQNAIVYSSQISTSIGLVRDFVPVYRISDDKTGLYDFVTKEFYPNIGTKEFILGNEV